MRQSTPLTRREFYRLTERCREYAFELASYEQARVNLAQCHRFNAWLPELKSYDLLEPALRSMKPARPIARWQMMVLVAVLGFLLLLYLGSINVRTVGFSYTFFFSLLLLYFIPERVYGTTIELLEGKLLRIVDTLDQLLAKGELGFSEAAFFQAKENLAAARQELRQQIDLAHRR